MGDQNIAWRDDLDNLLACCGEAQWVEETDARLTAILAERDSLLLRLDNGRTLLDVMCNQSLSQELPGEDYLHADFEAAYDTMVQNARELRRVLYTGRSPK